jgi:thiol-disulfide isomerase/thioredoxin
MKISMPKLSNLTGSVATSKVVIIVCLVLVALIVYYHITRTNRVNQETFTSEAVPEESGNNSSNPLVPEGNDLTLALFYAEWCPHCVQFKPLYEGEIKTHIENLDLPDRKVRVVSVDAEKEEDLASLYELSGFPTLYIIKSSGEPTEYQGDRTADGIEAFIRSL